jgi:hypothetical protein
VAIADVRAENQESMHSARRPSKKMPEQHFGSVRLSRRGEDQYGVVDDSRDRVCEWWICSTSPAAIRSLLVLITLQTDKSHTCCCTHPALITYSCVCVCMLTQRPNLWANWICIKPCSVCMFLPVIVADNFIRARLPFVWMQCRYIVFQEQKILYSIDF